METKRYVGVIVKCNDEVLLCKRNHNGSFPGMWSIPAGKLEEGETTQECAVREFLEETAIDISDEPLKFVGTIPRFTRDGKKMKGLMYVYLIEVDEKLEPDFDSAKDGDEHSEWKYYTQKMIKPEYTGTQLDQLLKIILAQN
jgi:mutator protein MutT